MVCQDQNFKNRELEIMKGLQHPNIVQMKNQFYSKPPNVRASLHVSFVYHGSKLGRRDLFKHCDGVHPGHSLQNHPELLESQTNNSEHFDPALLLPNPEIAGLHSQSGDLPQRRQAPEYPHQLQQPKGSFVWLRISQEARCFRPQHRLHLLQALQSPWVDFWVDGVHYVHRYLVHG